MHYRLATAAVVLIPIKLFGSDTNLALGRLPYDHDHSSSSSLSLSLHSFSSSRPLDLYIYFIPPFTLYATSFYAIDVSLPRNRNVLIRRTNERQWWFHFFGRSRISRLRKSPIPRIGPPFTFATLSSFHSLNVDRVENDPQLRFGSRSGKMIRARGDNFLAFFVCTRRFEFIQPITFLFFSPLNFCSHSVKLSIKITTTYSIN